MDPMNWEVNKEDLRSMDKLGIGKADWEKGWKSI